MKKLIFLFSLILLTNCSNDTVVNDCFSNIRLSATVNISNPEFIGLQVPSGTAITNLNGRSVLIINRGSSFRAFDLACPEGGCDDNMTFDGLFLTCPCDGKEYNSLSGSPIDGEGCSALEYNVLQSSSSTIQISI